MKVMREKRMMRMKVMLTRKPLKLEVQEALGWAYPSICPPQNVDRQ